jgi:hypothetical protein
MLLATPSASDRYVLSIAARPIDDAAVLKGNILPGFVVGALSAKASECLTGSVGLFDLSYSTALAAAYRNHRVSSPGPENDASVRQNLVLSVSFSRHSFM